MKKALFLLLLAVAALSGCASTNLAPVSSNGNFRIEEDEKRIWLRSEEEERDLNRSGLLYEDKELEAYLNDIARKLQPPAVYKSIPFKIKVIKNPYLNAFTYANGVIYVHTGILARMENEAQFATLLAHEMTHSTHRHGVKEFRHVQNKSAFLATFRTTLGGTPIVGGLVNALGELGTMASVSGYSSDLETEADTEGLKLMVKAGYDPQEAPKLFEQLKQELEEEEITEPFFFGTHPRVKERMKNYAKLLKGEYKERRGGTKNAELFQSKISRLVLDNAWLDLKGGRFKQAQRGAEKYQAKKANDARGYYLLGEVCRQRGEKGGGEKAKSYYQKAIAINPGYPDSFKAMGLMQYKQGEKGSAKKNLKQYLSLAPQAADREYIEEYLKECN